MYIEELDRELASLKDSPDENRVNTLLCQVVRFIMDKGYLFLLDINYPFEIVENCQLEAGSLVIVKEEPKDGFCLLKDIPLGEILQREIVSSSEEISTLEKMDYIEKMLFFIPRFEG